MNGVKTRGICRSEQTETRWRFAGWATATGAENTVRPRAYYRSCGSCKSVVLTLADVDDAYSFVRSVMADWARRAGDAIDKIDVENVVGDLYRHLWYLYGRWIPGNSFVVGKGNTFTGYASGILRKKINTFVARDVGDPTGPGRSPKAHSRSLSSSYEGLSGSLDDTVGVGGRGGLDFALGAVSSDPTGDSAASGVWLDAARHSSGAGGHVDGSAASPTGVA